MAILALSAGACGPGGGDNAPPGCLQVQPCGGDVVGTWNVLGACVNGPALSASVNEVCPAWTIAASVDISGTFTFDADLTYTFDVAETSVITQNVPLECTNFASCAAAEADLIASLPQSVSTCTGAATCTCRSTTTIPRTAVSGSYQAAGTTIQLTSGTSTTTDGYCVQGNTLHLMSLSSTMTGPTGQPVILADDVAQRQ